MNELDYIVGRAVAIAIAVIVGATLVYWIVNT